MINAFQSKENNPKQESDVSSDEPSILQKYQQHSLGFHLNFLLNAPQIILPLNSYSNEAILCDLGKLTMHTDSNNQFSSTLDEQHRITFENLSINRIVLDKENNSLNLFECSPFVTLINRHLNSENDNKIAIKILWDTIDFKLSKYDYAFINKILEEDFKEKIFQNIPQFQITEQQEENNEQDVTTELPPAKQSSPNGISSLNMQFDFQMKQIDLTIYLDEVDLKNNQTSRDENSRFISLTIQFIVAQFKQSADSTCHEKLQIQHLFADDLRPNNQNKDSY